MAALPTLIVGPQTFTAIDLPLPIVGPQTFTAIDLPGMYVGPSSLFPWVWAGDALAQATGSGTLTNAPAQLAGNMVVLAGMTAPILGNIKVLAGSMAATASMDSRFVGDPVVLEGSVVAQASMSSPELVNGAALQGTASVTTTMSAPGMINGADLVTAAAAVATATADLTAPAAFKVLGSSLKAPTSSARLEDTTIEIPFVTFVGTMVNGWADGVNASLPALVPQATVLVGSVFDASPSLPSMVGSASDAHRVEAALPLPTSSSTLLVGEAWTVDASVPRITGDATTATGRVFDVDASLRAPSSTATLLNGAVMSVDAPLPKATVAAQVFVGALFNGSAALPVLRVLSTLVSELRYNVSAALPTLRSVATALPESEVTAPASGADVDAWAVNLGNFGTTTYSNYPFHTLGVFNGVPIGVSADGVYQLNGATDEGVQISALIESGDDDFDSENLKRVPEIYLGYSADGDMELGIGLDGDRERFYPAKRVSAKTGTKIARAEPGQGLKSRYWRFKARNVKGADFFIESASLLVRVLSRKT